MWTSLLYVLLIFNCVNAPNTDPLRASITNQEQRAFIKCHVLLDTPAAEVYSMLIKIARSQVLSRSRVFLLYKEFQDRTRLETEDEPRSGRPRVTTDEMHREKLKELLNEDRDWSISELAESLDISYYATLVLLSKVEAKKIASRWVPHALKPAEKQKRVDICVEHLERYKRDPEFLERIIAIDETWIREYDPKDPFHSRHWRLPGQPP